jgi:hypothetical protein
MNKHTRVAALLTVNGVINLSITEHGLIVTNVFSDTFILDDEVLLQGKRRGASRLQNLVVD